MRKILLILLFSVPAFAQGPANQTARKVVVGVSNASVTGTTKDRLAKLTGAPSKAVVVATTDTGGAIGVVTGGAGTTGLAAIQTAGQTSCAFDGATTAGDYVSISSTTAGKCHDAGSTYPTSGQVIGRVLSTNGGAGTYSILLTPGVVAVAAVTPGGSNTQLQYNNSSAFGGISGVTSDGTNVTFGSSNLRATSPQFTTGAVFNGATSGTATVQAPAVAGTTTVTLPNASSTLPIFGQQITFSGPTVARTVTLPDANFTVARTDAANTFTGNQTINGTINGSYMPTYAQVSGSNATTTNTTATDITGLSVALQANAVYEFTAELTGNGADANGMKFAVNFSAAGATVECGIIADVAGTGTRTRRINALNTLTSQAFFTSSTDVSAVIKGIMTTGANAGNITIQYGKVTSGTATIYIGSYLKVTRIS